MYIKISELRDDLHKLLYRCIITIPTCAVYHGFIKDGTVPVGVRALRQVGLFICATYMVQPHGSVGAEFEAAGQGDQPAAHFPANCPGITHVPATVTHGHPQSLVIYLHSAATLMAVSNYFCDKV